MLEQLQSLIREELNNKNTTFERKYEIYCELKRLANESEKPGASARSQGAHSRDA